MAAYVARSSFISAMAPRPSVVGAEAQAVTSSFQRRMFLNDLRGTVFDVLGATSYSLLLIDIIDERFNVFYRGGERITDSQALRESGFLRKAGGTWSRLETMTDEHFLQWSEAVARFFERFQRENPSCGIAFLDADWATTASVESIEVPKFAGKSAEHANRGFERYRSLLATYATSADHVIRPPKEFIVSDVGHKWGLAPFHYTQGFYDYVADQLVKIAMLDSTT
ncbi:hypothetical protein BJY19_000220 [Arthrobacter cupressi]|nr:hypothetical protein [Arthrobacter cupressi]